LRRFTDNYDNPADSHSLSDHYVNAILEDSNGNLWVGTYSGGVNRYDAATDTFIRYQSDSDNPYSLGSESVFAIFQDRTGLMWFAGRGVDRLDLSSGQLALHRPPKGDQTEATAHRPEHLAIDSAGVTWLGSRSGMVRYEPATDAWSQHLVVPEHPDYPDNSVYSLYAGADAFRYVGGPQSIWPFLTTRGGYGPSYIEAPGTPSVIYVDRSEHLWAGMPFKGLVKYGVDDEPDQTLFQHDPDNPTSLSNTFIHFIHEDAAGSFWVGTGQGLNRLDRSTGHFQRFLYDPANPNGPSDNQFTSVAEGLYGELWFGTGRGLNRLDSETGVFEHFGSSHGLPHDQVNAVAIDRFNKVWIGTDAGLSRFDPDTGAMRNLFVENGLPDNQVVRLSLAPNGELFVATYAGLVSLQPEQFVTPPASPGVAVTGFEIFNAPVSPAADSSDGTFDSTNAGARHITITHKDDVISFEMAVFDYRDPARNRYAYQLEGVDKNWVYTEGAQRRASYTTLPAGEYIFRYKGMGSSGQWREGIQPIHLTVLPAPWLTGWAYLAYVTLLFLAVALFVRLRVRATLLRARTLENTVAQRTRELQQQKNTIETQSERLQQVAAAKDRLYANVSHEFRTPLTVILGPVERLLWEEHSSRRRTHLEIIRRNAQRLLRLVDQLMTFARIDVESAANPQPLLISKMVNTLVQSLKTLADDKNVQLEVRCQSGLWVACEADSLEKIVVNVISNAIKYTHEGGNINVCVEVEQSGEVALTVVDTGVGIPKDEQKAVFQRFYRVGDQKEMAAGSGLGLAMVKELVEANSGRVLLTSEPGVGTTVRVILPQCQAGAEGAEAYEGAGQESKIVQLEVASTDLQDSIESVEQEENDMPTALVIEDNADLCWHLNEVLGNRIHCEFVHDGEAGVSTAIETVPDIILCDVMLPKLNGFEVTRQIKQDDRTSHIPVIMLTARADMDSRIKGLQTLADDYITKPFNEAELRQRVDTLLSVREILRQRFAKETRRLTPEEFPTELGSRDRRFLERVAKVLEVHYADPDFDITEFASLIAMSERQLQRKLKALTSVSPREYIRSYRLEKALELLRTGEPAGSVAFSVGFSSQSYFTSCFKAQFGLTPGQIVGKAKQESPAGER